MLVAKNCGPKRRRRHCSIWAFAGPREMAPALDSSSSSNSSSVSATMRRRLPSLPPPDEGDDRRRSSRFGSVQQYQLEKQLDPQQLDKIIYQPGCSYSTAVAGQHATSATATEFNLSGFSQHLARSQCLSVLLFWKEAEEYLNMFSQGDRAACAQRIFQRYMRKGAEFEINLSGINDATVAGIEAKLTKPPGVLCMCPIRACGASCRLLTAPAPVRRGPVRARARMRVPDVGVGVVPALLGRHQKPGRAKTLELFRQADVV